MNVQKAILHQRPKSSTALRLGYCSERTHKNELERPGLYSDLEKEFKRGTLADFKVYLESVDKRLQNSVVSSSSSSPSS
jgi:hypothetical protein